MRNIIPALKNKKLFLLKVTSKDWFLQSVSTVPFAQLNNKKPRISAWPLGVLRCDFYLPTPSALSKPSISLPSSMTEKLPV
jgi:hypothetical protein